MKCKPFHFPQALEKNTVQKKMTSSTEKRKGTGKSECNLVVAIFSFIQMICTQQKFLVSVCLEPTLKSP